MSLLALNETKHKVMNTKPNPPSLSLVIPLYNEEKNVGEVYRLTKNILSSMTAIYEIILIDDGSTDKTYELLRGIQKRDNHIVIVKLNKNYGQMYAILAGFNIVKGEIVVVMDGDLQNDPNDIPQFLTEISNNDIDVVTGWRYNRKDSLLRKTISKLSNWLIGLKTGVKLHDYGCAFTMVRKQVIDKLIPYGAQARFIKPLIALLSDSICEIKVNHHYRVLCSLITGSRNQLR